MATVQLQSFVGLSVSLDHQLVADDDGALGLFAREAGFLRVPVDLLLLTVAGLRSGLTDLES